MQVSSARHGNHCDFEPNRTERIQHVCPCASIIGRQTLRKYNLGHLEARTSQSRGRTTVPRSGALVRILSPCSCNKSLAILSWNDMPLKSGLDNPEIT
jgi:hypothetical protein